MSKTLQIVRLVATEFENLSDETIEMWIDLTAKRCSVNSTSRRLPS